MIKEQLRQQILAQLETDLRLQTAAAKLAHDEAIDEESRPQNKYDTHSQEAAYLAAGQAKLVQEIRESIGLFQSLNLADFPPEAPIALGSLVAVGDNWYLIGPRSGGMEVKLPDDRKVLVITPGSPLGRQLMGRRTGEMVALAGRTMQAIRQVG